MSDIFPPRMSIEGQLTAAADSIADLKAQLEAARGLPRFNLEKAKGKDKYRVVQDDWGEFVFYNDLLKALEQKESDDG